MTNLRAVLGLADSADSEEIEKKYNNLIEKLEQLCRLNPKSRAVKVINKIKEAYEDKKSSLHTGRSGGTTEFVKPRLGQLCVMAGIISMEQLGEAVNVQRQTGEPLGEVLEDKNFLSRSQLEGLLMGQDLYDLEDYTNDPFCRQLVALRLITEDMAFIAQMDEKASGQPKGDSLVERGWLEPEILRVFVVGDET